MASGNVAQILRWYASHQRDLPWRRPDATAWAVLVSEVMLQQTPVARVLPVYEAWLARWPTPASLAAASAGGAVGAPGMPAGRAPPARDITDPDATPRRRGSRVGGRAAGTARDRLLHGRRGSELRVRATASGPGHQRAPGARAPGQRPGTTGREPIGSRGAAGRVAAPGASRTGGPMVGGGHGTGRTGVHRRAAGLCRVPSGRVLCLAAGRKPSRQ